MDFVTGKEYQVFGKVIAFNMSDGAKNVLVLLNNDENINLKMPKDAEVKINSSYCFTFKVLANGKRTHYVTIAYEDILNLPLNDEVIEAIERFLPCAPVPIKELEKELDKYIAMIKKSDIRRIVEDIFLRYRREFLIYPAAVKMHHHYIGGLAYHTLTIVRLALTYIKEYKCLDKDLLIAGALLHDIAKVQEFNGPNEDKYSLDGQLIGHLVLGALEIEKTAEKLNIGKTEDVLLLEHMVISHHGQLQFGAAKKPETPEAVLLWLLDMTDSKLRVVEESYLNMDDGSWSEAIGVLEKAKFYKKKKED